MKGAPNYDDDEPQGPVPGPIAGFFGILIITVGFLICALSGICTLSFLGGGGIALLPWALVIGGLPFFVGSILIMAGLGIYKR